MTQQNYQAIATGAGYEIKENVLVNKGFYCVMVGDRDNAPTTYPTEAEAWKACCDDNGLLTGKRAFAPNGQEIVGTLDTLTALCHAKGFTRAADGSLDMEYAGGSRIHYDEQRPMQRNGMDVYLDEEGHDWTADQIHLEGEEPRAIAPVIASPGPTFAAVLDMLKGLTDEYDSAIETHIYGDDPIPDDCAPVALVKASRALIAAAEANQAAPPAIDWRSIAQDLAGALDSCSHQIGQMQGMFGDGDGTIQESLDDAEEVRDRYADAIEIDAAGPGAARHIAVVIEGGMLSTIISDDPAMIGREVTVIDYDTDGSEEVVMIPQSGGKPASAHVGTVTIEKADLDIAAVAAMEPEQPSEV